MKFSGYPLDTQVIIYLQFLICIIVSLNQRRSITLLLPLDGTHFVVVRGLIQQVVPTRVRQLGELNLNVAAEAARSTDLLNHVKTRVKTD